MLDRWGSISRVLNVRDLRNDNIAVMERGGARMRHMNKAFGSREVVVGCVPLGLEECMHCAVIQWEG